MRYGQVLICNHYMGAAFRQSLAAAAAAAAATAAAAAAVHMKITFEH